MSTNSNLECAICYDQGAIEDLINMHDSYFHLVHRECFRQWVNSFPRDNSFCPLCRQSISARSFFRLFGPTKSVLHYAMLGAAKELEDLLAENENEIDINFKDTNGMTALMYAAKKGCLSTAELILSWYPDIHMKDSHDMTALMYACESGHMALVQMLTGFGADINGKDIQGRTPIMFAAKSGNLPLVKLLVKAGAKLSRLLVGATPLHFACEAGHMGVVDYLVWNGCSMAAKDQRNMTALMHAAAKGHSELVRYLIQTAQKQKTQVNIVEQETVNGMTSLMLAARHGHLETVKVFIELGARVTASGEGKMTPLMHAARQGHEEIIKVLLEAGANPEDLNEDKWKAEDLDLQQVHVRVIRIAVNIIP